MSQLFFGPGFTTTIFVLMTGSDPIEAYTDKATAERDCWICNEGEKFSDEPQDFYVKEVALNTANYEPTEA
jgi:hypothetical protein